MEGFWVAAGLVFVAEIGDKSQLVALTLATRFSARPVLLGVAIAATAVHGLSVLAGSAIGSAVPDTPMTIVAAVTFAGFGLWAFVEPDEREPDENPAFPARRIVLGVAGLFFVSEFGDKTMLATFALAANQGAIGVWLGATVGMVVADALAIAAGFRLRERLSAQVLRSVSAAVFLGFAAVLAGSLLV